MKGTSSGEQHPLIGSRFVGAVGLGALASIGIALMLAKVLIFIGLLISLACCAGVIWIYWAHFAVAYRALVNKTAYEGATPNEMICAFVMLVALAPTSIAVYSIVTAEEVQTSRGKLSFAGISPFKFAGSQDYRINAQLSNNGNLDVIRASLLITGMTARADLTVGTIKEALDRLESDVGSMDSVGSKNGIKGRSGFIAAGSSSIITLQNLELGNTDDYTGSPVLKLTDAEYADFLDAKLAIYLLFVARFEDELSNGKSYWEIRFCGYLIGSLSYFHNCSQNFTTKVVAKR